MRKLITIALVAASMAMPSFAVASAVKPASLTGPVYSQSDYPPGFPYPIRCILNPRGKGC